MTVKLGDPAIYYPRVPYGRQSELFCFVTRIVDAEKGIVDIVTFPAAGEFQHINNVMPKGEGIQIHCWEPREEDSRVTELEQRLASLEAIANTRISAPAEVSYVDQQLVARDALEALNEAQAKRGPGRPRKDAA